MFGNNCYHNIKQENVQEKYRILNFVFPKLSESREREKKKIDTLDIEQWTRHGSVLKVVMYPRVTRKSSS